MVVARHRNQPGLAVALAFTVVALGDSAAWGDVRDQCIAASSSAQDFRRDAKLIAAREQLLVCARDDCPAVVKTDCARWLDELEAVIPTVTLAVQDERNEDIVLAHVSIDGVAFLDRLDGKAVPLDPGVHNLHVEADGIEAADRELVVHEGEKGRVVVISVVRRRDAPVVLPHVEPKAPPRAVPANASPPVSHATSSAAMSR